MKKKLILICDNSGLEHIELQAKRQSYTLGCGSNLLQSIRKSNDWMYVHGIYGKVLYKIFAKRIVKKSNKICRINLAPQGK